MVMLSLLGSELFYENSSRAIATSKTDSRMILIISDNNIEKTLVEIDGVDCNEKYKIVLYQLTNENTNPRKVWHEESQLQCLDIHQKRRILNEARLKVCY